MFNIFKRTQFPGVVGVLDVGSYSTVCLIARLFENSFKIIGAHRTQTKGFNAGVVSNMGEMFSCVASAVFEAEQKAETTLKKLYLLAPAQSCSFQNVLCKANVAGGEITNVAIDKLIRLAKEETFDANYQPLHISTGSFVLDGVSGIESPLGLIGNELKGNVNIISAKNSLLNNLKHCVKKCHMQVQGVISSVLTPALACIWEEEEKAGCVVINFGASCTTICVYKNQNFELIATIPLGGNIITNDIACVLDSTFSHSERIKNLHGCLLSNIYDERESIFVPVVGEKINSVNDINNHKIPKAKLVNIIQARFEDIVTALKVRLRPFLGKYKIIVTGGVAKTPGLKEFLSSQLNVAVRLGQLESLSGSLKESPELACSVGMLNYLIAKRQQNDYHAQNSC